MSEGNFFTDIFANDQRYDERNYIAGQLDSNPEFTAVGLATNKCCACVLAAERRISSEPISDQLAAKAG
jgi:hypothetical protein